MGRVERLLKVPGVRTLYQHYFNRKFEGPGMGFCRGVYASFEAARADAPATKPVGYDHPGPASMYRDRLHRVYPSDYAVLLWLERLLRGGARRVFDIGGHVGVAFYSFRRYLDFPDDLEWTVMDVPAVCEAGTALAEREGVSQRLKFESNFDGLDGTDVLFAAGSLQYVEAPIWKLVSGLKRPPPTLLINNTPVRTGPSFVTLQNIGVAYCPYAIFNESDILAELGSRGYALHDRWTVHTHRCDLPLTPEYSVHPYSGFVFSSAASPLGQSGPLDRLAEDARSLRARDGAS